jgi:hypothetical protein
MDFYFAEPQTELEKLIGGHFHINATGKILSGDDVKFQTFLERTSPPPRTTVYIDSIGGDVDAAIGIGRTIRDAWFSTSIGCLLLDPDRSEPWLVSRDHLDGVCYSAATLIYVGGRLRFLPKSFKFGVHQFSFKNPSPAHVGQSQVLSAKIATYIHDMGIKPEFTEISSSVPGNALTLLDEGELAKLGVTTSGLTKVTWSIESRNKILYVKGERDSIYGHHKVMLCFAKGVGFQFWALIEAQGREKELTGFGMVEVVINGEDERIDISKRCFRGVLGNYVNVFSKITQEEARKIAYSESFGVQVRFSPEADIFFGISAMETSAGSDMLITFFENLSV